VGFDADWTDTGAEVVIHRLHRLTQIKNADT
jgi:hypothetical protein